MITDVVCSVLNSASISDGLVGALSVVGGLESSDGVNLSMVSILDIPLDILASSSSDGVVLSVSTLKGDGKSDLPCCGVIEGSRSNVVWCGCSFSS